MAMQWTRTSDGGHALLEVLGPDVRVCWGGVDKDRTGVGGFQARWSHNDPAVKPGKIDGVPDLKGAMRTVELNARLAKGESLSKDDRVRWLACMVAAIPGSRRGRRHEVRRHEVWLWEVQDHVLKLDNVRKPSHYHAEPIRHEGSGGRDWTSYRSTDRERVGSRVGADLREAAKRGLVRKHQWERGLYIIGTQQALANEARYGTLHHPLDEHDKHVAAAGRKVRAAIDYLRNAVRKADLTQVGDDRFNEAQAAVAVLGDTIDALTAANDLLWKED